MDWDAISHVTKIDPAKELPSDLGPLEGTDLVLVGGSDGVTEANTIDVLREVGEVFPDTPLLQEPYSTDHVSRETLEYVDRLAVPAVYNGDRANFVGKHLDLFTEIGRKPADLLGAQLPFVGELIASKGKELVTEIADTILAEGYVVQHLESAAAAVAGVEERYTPEQVAGAALATDAFYDFPVFYVEYSGTYGGTKDVEAASEYLDDTALFYGGGIDSREKAEDILAAGADAIVVGDCFHDRPEEFRRTVPSTR